MLGETEAFAAAKVSLVMNGLPNDSVGQVSIPAEGEQLT